MPTNEELLEDRDRMMRILVASRAVNLSLLHLMGHRFIHVPEFVELAKSMNEPLEKSDGQDTCASGDRRERLDAGGDSSNDRDVRVEDRSIVGGVES